MLKKFSLTILLSLVFTSGLLTYLIYIKSNQLQEIENNRYKLFSISHELRESSEDLTKYCRTYVSTGDDKWEKKYWQVLDARNGKIPRPDGKQIALKDSIQNLGVNAEEFEKLKLAEKNSNDLVRTEEIAFNAMKGLFLDDRNTFTVKREPDVDFARRILFDDKYHKDKEKIMKPIREFSIMLNKRAAEEAQILRGEINVVVLFFGIVFILIVLFSIYEIVILKNNVQRKNIEVTQLNEEIIRNNEELISTNKSKDKFFSIIAHDLKNPIQSHMGLSELLLMSHKDLDSEEREKIINMMNSSILEIKKLLDNLLQWSMSQVDGITLFKEEHHLHSLVNDSISVYAQQSAEKNISILNHVPEEVRVYVDKETISVAFRNIISNAIKYSYEGSKILLTSEEDMSQGLYHVSITDYGTGISEDEVKKLFELTTNNSLPGTNNEKGTGLGLILSKDFIEQNGGQLTVESIEGSGTTFTASLPINDN